MIGFTRRASFSIATLVLYRRHLKIIVRGWPVWFPLYILCPYSKSRSRSLRAGIHSGRWIERNCSTLLPSAPSFNPLIRMFFCRARSSWSTSLNVSFSIWLWHSSIDPVRLFCSFWSVLVAKIHCLSFISFSLVWSTFQPFLYYAIFLIRYFFLMHNFYI